MISLTLSVNKLSALSYLSNVKVLESFNFKVIDNYTIEKDNKRYFIRKKTSLSEVEYTLERKKFVGKQTLTLKFVILPKKDSIVLSIDGDSDLLNLFNEKKFINDLMIVDIEKITESKTLMSFRVKKEELPDVINMAISKSIHSTLLLWFSSESKFVRMKIKNGELIERIGEFDALGENVDVLIKQLAVT